MQMFLSRFNFYSGSHPAAPPSAAFCGQRHRAVRVEDVGLRVLRSRSWRGARDNPLLVGSSGLELLFLRTTLFDPEIRF